MSAADSEVKSEPRRTTDFAMDGLKPPPILGLDSANLAKTWKSWKEEFTLYTDLTMPDAEETTKVKLFYYLLGERGRELLDTLSGGRTSASARRTVSSMMALIDEHCNPKLNETVERYKFFVRNQGQDENIDRYVTDLRALASTCNFGNIGDSLIRDRIVCGTNSPTMRERLLREENLSLEKCVQICRASELSRENSKTIQGQKVEEIHAMKKTQRREKRDEICCNFCGITHEKNKLKCPALGKKCKKCGKENHFAVKCKSKQEKTKKSRPIHTVSESSDSYEDIMTISEVCENKETINQMKEAHSMSQQLFAGMLLDKKLVNFQIDCGATCNVIPMQLLNPDTQLEKTDKVLVMYNKSRLKPLGKCKVKLRNPRNDKLYRLEFQVVDQDDRMTRQER